MAILGEVACLSAAIVALPAFLLWRRARPLDAATEGSVESTAESVRDNRDSQSRSSSL